jgi:hypothetical protein
MSKILQPNVPCKFEGRNIRTPKRSGATQDFYLVQFEITREAWEELETVPKTAILGGVIWYNDGDPVEVKEIKPRKPAKEKGEYGAYWQDLCKRGVFHNADLQELLRYSVPNESDPKKAFKKLFQVESLTFISPQNFEIWLDEQNLAAVKTMSRQAIARLETV